VRGRVLVQILIFAAVAAVLGYALLESVDGWADWVVFGVVVMAALGGAIAVWQRQYPAVSKKRTFTRDSDSEW
jgi:threonine/homoserine efflux transporter RhtA